MAHPVMHLFIVLVAVYACRGEYVQTDTVLVDTTYGTLIGSRLENEDGKTQDHFFGIPFASPPLGELRWQKPIPPESWEGIRGAFFHSQHCTHAFSLVYPFIGFPGFNGEDCLYLNVYVPNGVEENSDDPLPVMVYYYGGAFILGTGQMYPSDDLAEYGNVIVVTFNYRLSAIGWMSSGDETVPGNYGLWDAQAALTWVNQNIANFGGDPARVTIFGQSAGAAMVSHSVASPAFDELFQRAIAISGASNAIFALTESPRHGFLMLSDIFNCSTSESAEIVECLREQPDSALDLWALVGFISQGQLPGFMPVIDGEMIVRQPRESFEQGFGKEIDYIAGATHHDGGLFILLTFLGLAPSGFGFAESQESMDDFTELFFNGTGNPEELQAIVYEKYPDMVTADNLTRAMAATDFFTDLMFSAPTHFEAVHHAKNSEESGGGSTYLYDYKYLSSFFQYYDWMEPIHVDDLYSLFGPVFMDVFRSDFLQADFDEIDIQVSHDWMGYLANFAYTGNPNNGPHRTPVPWSEFNPSTHNRIVTSENSYMENIESEQLELYRFFGEEFRSLIEPPPPPEYTSFSDLAAFADSLLGLFPASLQQELREILLNGGIHPELRDLMMDRMP